MTIAEVPLISVCIPVFNGENYIRECIDSVLRQTEGNFELIVADNCSTDRTLEIVGSFRDPRIRVVRSESNIGSINNFNKCIQLSKGKYFILLPHDDILLPTALYTFSRPLIEDSKIGLAYSSYYTIDAAGKRIGFRMIASDDRVLSGEEAIGECIIHGSPIQCAMVRAKLFSRLGSFDKDLFVWCDVDLWCRIFLDGNKAAYFKTPQNCVRIHPEQGQRAFLKRDKDNVRILSDHLGELGDSVLIKNDSYHTLVFKNIQKLFNKIPADSDLQKLRPLSSRWIVGAQVKDLLISLKLGNWASVRQDIGLIVKFFKWAGFFRTIPVLLSMPLEMIIRSGKNLISQKSL